MKFILIFIFIAGGWFSSAKRVSTVASKTYYKSEFGFRTKHVLSDEEDEGTFQSFYRGRFTYYAKKGKKWDLGFTTASSDVTSPYVSQGEQIDLGIDIASIELDFPSLKAKVISGKIENPHNRVRGVNAFLFDKDLRLYGGYVSYKKIYEKRRKRFSYINVDVAMLVTPGDILIHFTPTSITDGIFTNENKYDFFDKSTFIPSLQVQYHRKVSSYDMSSGILAYGFLKEDDTWSMFSTEDAFYLGEIFLKVKRKEWPVVFYGSVFTILEDGDTKGKWSTVVDFGGNIPTGGDDKGSLIDNLNYFAGLSGDFKKLSLDYVFVNLEQKNLSSISKLMDSNIIAGVAVTGDGLQAHSLSLSYELPKKYNSHLKLQYVNQSGNKEKEQSGKENLFVGITFKI